MVKVYTVTLPAGTNPISTLFAHEVVLKSDFDKLVKVVQFYADKDSWFGLGNGESSEIDFSDTEYLKRTKKSLSNECIGGKTARTVLAEMGIE